MKPIARDRKPSRRPDAPVRPLDDRDLRAVRGGSSVIKPEQILPADDWENRV